MQPLPYIPDNAPFTPEQRGWLNGFLAGLFSNANGMAAAPQAAPAALKIAVLHASQSGTGEGLARKLAKELKAKGHTITVASLEAMTPAALATEQHALFIASTYGEGDPPDAAKPFFQQLCREDAPRLDTLRYTVLALGDSHYEHFCKFGTDLDERLSTLGAQRLSARVESDLDVDAPFALWKASLLDRLQALTQEGNGAAPPEIAAPTPTPALAAPAVAMHTRENPYHAMLVEKRPLTHDVSSKLTLHLAFNLRDSTVLYEAGDALGVIPRNDARLVDEVLAAASLTGAEPVTLPKIGTMPVSDALMHHCQFTRLNRKLVEAVAQRAGDATLLGLLAPEQQTHLDTFCYDRGFIDLLVEHPGAFANAEDLVSVLPRLAPRLYSISSSPAAHTGEVHTTVAVVRYRSHNRDRGGVCSTLFADRTETGEALPVYIQPNKRFRLPLDASAPIIMIGPGTGIAPFRSFLHERRALGHAGRNWLFFGERSAATDFLYRDELTAMQTDGHLSRLDLAFSRDQERKIYVQDRMLEQGAEFFRWLEEGASIYVCGDATHMAKDVDATLHTIVAQQAGLPRDAATEYVEQLKEEHRYHRDVY